MTPTTRGQTARGTVKFPVICQATFDPELLNTILESEHLVLAAQTDLSELLINDDRPIDNINNARTLPQDGKLIGEFMVAARAREGISSKAFVVLDSQTVRDGGKSCQVTTHDDDADEENYRDRVPIRCELSSALAALKMIEQSPDGQEHKTARALRNEAAIAGGVWSQASAARQHAKAARITSTDYPQRKDWDVHSGSTAGEDPLPYVPVFRTAHISLETLTAFVQETYDERPEVDPSIAHYSIAIVTSLEHPFHPGPAEPPVLHTAVLPSLLPGASPSECNTLTRHLFPPQDRSQLNYNHFIVVDELTERSKTVLLTCNWEFEATELQLLRSDFRSALNAVLAPDTTILTMDTMASHAAMLGDGVNRV